MPAAPPYFVYTSPLRFPVILGRPVLVGYRDFVECCCQSELSLVVTSPSVLSWGSRSPGKYRVSYVSGAMIFGSVAAGFTWQVHRLSSGGIDLGPLVAWNGGSAIIGNGTGAYATQAAAEAANAGAIVQFAHGGGEITAQIFDTNYGDNTGGPIVLSLLRL